MGSSSVQTPERCGRKTGWSHWSGSSGRPVAGLLRLGSARADDQRANKQHEGSRLRAGPRRDGG